MSLRNLLAFTLLLSGLIQLSYGGIVTFKPNKTKISTEEEFMHKEGMFAIDDAPSSSSPGNGESYIKIEFSAHRVERVGNASITVLTFHHSEKSKIGVEVGKTVQICCTPELEKAGNCTELGSLIYDHTPSNFLWVHPLNFDDSISTVEVNETHNITKSGMYYFYIVNCNYSNAGEVYLDGRVVFMHPYGYLNGEYYYLLPFYGTLSLLYMIVGVFWLWRSIKYRKQLLKLQKAIAGIITLGILETAVNTFDYVGYNNTGVSFVGAMIVGVLVSTIKKTLSRILVLVVSLGYGVVKPTLAESKIKVIILGVLYVIFSGALNINELVQRNVAESLGVLLFLVFPVAVLDTAFYWWILMALIRTTQQLQVRKQSIKLTMYKRFFAVLILSGIVSALVILAQLIVVAVTDQDENWKTTWIWKAFWDILYYFILVGIVVIWRPTSNNTRYAYSEMSNIDADEITLQPLGSFGDISQRKKSEDVPATSSKELADIERADSKKLAELGVSFSIDDEDDDSKMD